MKLYQLNVNKSLPVATAKLPTGIQALPKISLEKTILKQNSKYPTTVLWLEIYGFTEIISKIILCGVASLLSDTSPGSG